MDRAAQKAALQESAVAAPAPEEPQDVGALKDSLDVKVDASVQSLAALQAFYLTGGDQIVHSFRRVWEQVPKSALKSDTFMGQRSNHSNY